MKHLALIILVIILSSCREAKDKPSLDLSKQLAGPWINIGYFDNGNPDYDTLFVSFQDRFDGSISEIEHIIWTDSGTFKHIYAAETERFIRIDSIKELSISEFEFQTDSTGIVYDYYIDTAKTYNEHPKTFGISDSFKILITDTSAYLEFFYPNRTSSKTLVQEISHDQLILEHTVTRTSRFKRLNAK